MALWRFLDYSTEDGNLIQRWYGNQGPDVQAAFDVTVRDLSEMEDWSDAHQFKVLTGRHAGLSELRFKIERRHQGKKIVRRFRPVGIWREAEREFVFLLGCEKMHRGVLDPPGAFDTALRLKERLERGEGELDEHT